MTTVALCKALERAVKMQGDLFNFDDLMALIESGEMQSFADNDTWAITSITEYPRRKVLDLLLVVGKLKPALELENRIIEFARSNGVTMMRASGRVGWLPFALERNWKVVATTYHKDI